MIEFTRAEFLKLLGLSSLDASLIQEASNALAREAAAKEDGTTSGLEENLKEAENLVTSNYDLRYILRFDIPRVPNCPPEKTDCPVPAHQSATHSDIYIKEITLDGQIGIFGLTYFKKEETILGAHVRIIKLPTEYSHGFSLRDANMDGLIAADSGSGFIDQYHDIEWIGVKLIDFKNEIGLEWKPIGKIYHGEDFNDPKFNQQYNVTLGQLLKSGQLGRTGVGESLDEPLSKKSYKGVLHEWYIDRYIVPRLEAYRRQFKSP